MEIGYKYKEYEIPASSRRGVWLFIEQYAEKPYFVKMWRYGLIKEDGTRYCVKSGLLSRPNPKRCAASLAGMV